MENSSHNPHTPHITQKHRHLFNLPSQQFSLFIYKYFDTRRQDVEINTKRRRRLPLRSNTICTWTNMKKHNCWLMRGVEREISELGPLSIVPSSLCHNSSKLLLRIIWSTPVHCKCGVRVCGQNDLENICVHLPANLTLASSETDVTAQFPKQPPDLSNHPERPRRQRLIGN